MNGIVDKARAWLARSPGVLPGWPRLQGRRGSAITAVMAGDRCLAVRVEASASGALHIRAASAGGPEVLPGWRKLAAGSQPLLVLGTAARHLLTLDRPQVPEAELGIAARWPAAAAQDIDPDQLLCTALELPQTGSAARHQMLAISAPLAPVQAQLARLRQARLEVRAIDVIDSALLGMLHLQAGPQEACVVLAPATGSLCIALMWQGRFCALRTLALPQNHPSDDADYRDTLALHVQRTVDVFERQATMLALRHVLLSLPSISGEGFEAVASALPLPARRFELARAFEIDAAARPTLNAHEDLHALACVAASRLLQGQSAAARAGALAALGAPGSPAAAADPSSAGTGAGTGAGKGAGAQAPAAPSPGGRAPDAAQPRGPDAAAPQDPGRASRPADEWALQ
ncbi:MAG: hypothetical protein JNJ71_07410 [Rubrivivax sp.]|nr:hypothetical protein [Rubrivivax sp.]